MKKHFFSLVEILLALGVVAIGICSIMVLFPIGANASRDAAMETFAANSADQLLHMLKYRSTIDWANLNGIQSNGKPGYIDLADLNTAFPGDLSDNIFYKSGNQSCYLVVNSRQGAPSNSTDPNIDSKVIILVWREPIIAGDVAMQYGCRLIAEVSWPAELPSGKRQTYDYSLDVFNNTKQP